MEYACFYDHVSISEGCGSLLVFYFVVSDFKMAGEIAPIVVAPVVAPLPPGIKVPLPLSH